MCIQDDVRRVTDGLLHLDVVREEQAREKEMQIIAEQKDADGRRRVHEAPFDAEKRSPSGT